MTELDLLNPYIELELAGKKVRVRRLSYAKRRALEQKAWLEARIATIRDQAKAFDPDQASVWIKEQIAAIPTGPAFVEVCQKDATSETMLAVLHAATDGSITAESLELLLDDASKDEVATFFAYITGSKKKSASHPRSGEQSAG